VERAAVAAPDTDALLGAIPSAVQQLVGCGPVFAAASDPLSLHFTRAARREISDAAAAQFMALEAGTPDVVKFRELAVSRDPVDSLMNATDSTPDMSRRWREVIEPLGWGDELRVACRDGGRTWGFLCLHRGGGEAAFSGDDAAALREVSPILAAAFRRTALAGAGVRDDATPGPGVVVLDDELVVTSMSGTAAQWLETLGPADAGLPIALMSVAVHALSSGDPQTVAVITRDRRWLSVHASVLHGPDGRSVAVLLQPAHPIDALPSLAAAMHLTPRETEVTEAVLRGLSDRAIARTLAISEYTVQDHLKHVYAKTNTRGRAELAARLLLG